MQRCKEYFYLIVAMSLLCTSLAMAQTPAENQSPGYIRPDDGGAPGYQHSIDRSRFSVGQQSSDLRRVEENGFRKILGPEGVFAVDSRNGLALMIRSGGSDKS